MIEQAATVLWNKSVGPAFYKIGMTCSGHYASAKPGQFIMLGLSGRLDPLLRRPFSIHNLITESGAVKGFELLYKVVGKATGVLASLKPGSVVDILGPLGSGFRVPLHAQRIYLAAGGIGVAPMVFLAAHLRDQKDGPANLTVFLGGRTRADLLCQEDFARMGIAVHASTDDGSAGDQCLVTDPLENAVAQVRPDVIFACGPMGMLGCVVGIAEKHRVPCQISIETVMACGVGACLGCAVESRSETDRFLHACLDGPVFDGQRLKF